MKSKEAPFLNIVPYKTYPVSDERLLKAMDRLMDIRNAEALETLSNCDLSIITRDSSRKFKSLLLESYRKRIEWIRRKFYKN